jgi:hypothetical protein
VVACVAFAAVMAPWVVRNERVLHAFVPTRSILGVELYESTLERNDGFPWGTTLPLWPGDPEFKRYVRMGEVQVCEDARRGGEGADSCAAGQFARGRWTGFCSSGMARRIRRSIIRRRSICGS